LPESAREREGAPDIFAGLSAGASPDLTFFSSLYAYDCLMKLASTAVSALLILSLVGCGSAKDEEPAGSTENLSCLEIESAKLLDETGSNADYAMEKAAEICK